MEWSLIAGFGVFLFAAICNGAFAFPQKFVKNFPWENTWGSFWFFAMVVIPAIVTPFFVKDVLAIWSAVDIAVLIKTYIFGILWGVGAITFGIGVSAIGLSIGFSIIMGLAIGVGSLLPLIVLYPEVLNTPAGNITIAAIAICILGVAICGYAGVLKERSIAANNTSDVSKKPEEKKAIKAIVICVISGLFSACLNLGFAFAQDITDLATMERFGNPGWCAGLVTWILVFAGGFTACGIYCVILLFKNSTWFTAPSPTKQTVTSSRP